MESSSPLTAARRQSKWSATESGGVELADRSLPFLKLWPHRRKPKTMILKTYARIFTTDMDKTLVFLQALVGVVPDYRFTMKEIGLEIAGIADFCVVAGHPDKLLPVRASQGPLIVDDLDLTKALLVAQGATIAKPDAESETGRYFYAVHPDGSEIEYVEWNTELRIRVIGS